MHLPRQVPGADFDAGSATDGPLVDGGTLPGFPAAEMSAASKQIVTVPTTTELWAPSQPHKSGVSGVAIALPIVAAVAVLFAVVTYIVSCACARPASSAPRAWTRRCSDMA